MFDSKTKKIIILSSVIALIVFIAVSSLSIVFGLNIMLDSALYASPKHKLAKAQRYADSASTTQSGGTVFVGDSIIEMYDLKRHFPDKGYINRGISGDRSLGLSERLDSNVLAVSPSKLIIMIGINDLGYNVALEDFIKNYSLILDTIRTTLPDCAVSIMALFPLRYESSIVSRLTVRSRTHQLVLVWNNEIGKLAKEKGVNYIDLHSALSDPYGRLQAQYTREGLHISEAGYKKVSSLLSSYL